MREVGALEATVLRGTEGNGTSPFFSPDGQSIGFLSGPNGRILKRVSVLGGPAQTIASLDATPLGAEWAPDDTILFSLDATRSGLLRIPAVGGEVEQLTTVDVEAGDQQHGFPEVLPGGDAILFTIAGADGARLAALSLATGEITDLGIAGSDPTYSPTGHIVFSVSDGMLRAVGFDPDRLAVTATNPVPVIENVNTRSTGVANFGLAANGSAVFMSGVGEAAPRTLVWVDRDGREEPVGAPPRAYETPRVSPDGTRVAVAVDGDVWVTELARPGTLRRVTTDDATERFPLWTPDGERLLFESNRTGAPAIFSKAADGRGDAEPVLIQNWFEELRRLVPTN